MMVNSKTVENIFNKVRGHDQHDCGGNYDSKNYYTCSCEVFIISAIQSEVDAAVRAERWLFSDGRYPNQLKSLTRLLRKVAREAARKQRESSAMVAHNWLYEHGICDGTVLVVDAIRKAKVST